LLLLWWWTSSRLRVVLAAVETKPAAVAQGVIELLLVHLAVVGLLKQALA
jgi:hypothetical protein